MNKLIVAQETINYSTIKKILCLFNILIKTFNHVKCFCNLFVICNCFYKTLENKIRHSFLFFFGHFRKNVQEEPRKKTKKNLCKKILQRHLQKKNCFDHPPWSVTLHLKQKR